MWQTIINQMYNNDGQLQALLHARKAMLSNVERYILNNEILVAYYSKKRQIAIDKLEQRIDERRKTIAEQVIKEYDLI